MNLIKRAFELANKNIILLCALILFYCVTGVYVYFIKMQGLGNNVISVILYGIMLTAFFAGFFNIIKYIVNDEHGKMRFLEGVGDYFLPMLGVGALSLIFYFIPFTLGMVFLEKAFGDTNLVVDFLNKLYTETSTETIIKNTNPEVILHALVLLLSLWLIWVIVSFILLYWVPVLYLDREKNILKALFGGIVFLFKKFWVTLGVCILTLVVVSVISLFETLAAAIPLVGALLNIFSLYITIVFLFIVFLVYKAGHEQNNEK